MGRAGRAALMKRVGYYPNPHERCAVGITKHGAEFVVARGMGAAAGFYRTGKVEGMFPLMAGV
jgi:hypothetical protein